MENKYKQLLNIPLDKEKEKYYKLVVGRMKTEKLHNSIDFNN